jgi:hypothetical protein
MLFILDNIIDVDSFSNCFCVCDVFDIVIVDDLIDFIDMIDVEDVDNVIDVDADDVYNF